MSTPPHCNLSSEMVSMDLSTDASSVSNPTSPSPIDSSRSEARSFPAIRDSSVIPFKGFLLEGLPLLMNEKLDQSALGQGKNPKKSSGTTAIPRRAPQFRVSSKANHVLRMMRRGKCEPVAAMTFASFGKLPPELREKVWGFALPGPRVVQMRIKLVVAKYSKHQRGFHLKSTTPVPSMLHTCSESRAIALQHYELGMGSHLSRGRTYIDFTKDTIYFGDVNESQGFTMASLLRDTPEKDLSKIRKLAVSQNVWNSKPFCNVHVLLDFRNLEELILVMEREGAGKCRNVTLVKPSKSDWQFTSFTDPEMHFDDDMAEMFWPADVEEIMTEHLFEVFVD
ncbi:hypothetical protein B0J14DRAFT_695492 [Halenospora varia]|nr:hypothetical protein B0J14DRAFT_695492 [Halenospora varia]